MFNCLTPTTLAAIVADLLEQKADDGIPAETEIAAERAYRAGVANAGKEDFDKMVQEALSE